MILVKRVEKEKTLEGQTRLKDFYSYHGLTFEWLYKGEQSNIDFLSKK